jgi:O-antigen ligase
MVRILNNSFLNRININNIVYFTSFLMAFFLPISIKLSNLFLVLFFISSAFLFLIIKDFKKRNYTSLFYTTMLLFLINVVGLLITETPSEGIKALERCISFFLCPFLLFFHSEKSLFEIKNKLFNGIIFGSLLSVIVLLCNNFINYFSTRPLFSFDDEIFSYYHTYYYFTDFLKIHPTYLGSYIILSIAIVLNRVIKNTNKKMKIINFWILLILSIGVLFLNSRIIFFLYFLILIFYLLLGLFKLFKLKRIKQGIILLVVVCSALFFMFNSSISNTFIYSRLTKELSWELSDQVDTKYNSKTHADSRIVRWKSGLKVIERKPIFGYGTRTEKGILAVQYKKDGLENSYKLKYDSHNLFLTYTIEFGMIGLLVLCFYLFTNVFLSIKYKNIEYFIFFNMIIIICVFESFLKNNAGITFVAFFSAIFYFTKDYNQISEQ